MILFWVICAAFILIALVFVLPPAVKRSAETNRKTEDERRQANIAVYRDQLAELESDLQNGIASQEQYAHDREEIERRLLEDTQSKKPVIPPPSVLNRALFLALVGPVAALIYDWRFKTTLPFLGLISPVAALVYYFRFKKTTPSPIRLSARSTTYGLGFAIPLLAVVFYLNVGNPKAVEGPPPVQTQANVASGQRTQAQIEANVDALAKRLQSNPSDAQGWIMLARSYSSMDKFAESAGAYTKATELTPNDADLWAEFAFATAMANGRSLEGRPMELIDRALQVEPENAKALQLAGSAAFQAKDYKKAVDYWQRVLKQVPPGSEVAETIQERINEAKSLAENK